MDFLLDETGQQILDETTGTILGNLEAFVLSASTQIASGAATSTTAQLTPPSGKTTANFSALKVSDDTNPITGNIGNNRYGEVEWSLVSTDDAELTDYEFRVIYNGQPLDGYTVTPTMTVSSSGGSSTIIQPTGDSNQPRVGTPQINQTIKPNSVRNTP
jgi:hypothetical protein